MFLDRDGVHLHYELHGPVTGPPIVLVHGFASDYQLNWVGTRWQETLVAAGRRVIGLDCRGHGRSDKPHDPNDYGLVKMARDVVQLLIHLNIAQADYLGYSMGGRIGVEALQSAPSRLLKVVLAGVGWTGALRNSQSVADALRGGHPSTEVAKRFFDFAASRTDNDLEALAACILAPMTDPDPERLARATNPVLLVVGADDDIAGETQRLCDALPNARLVTLAGRNHMSAVPAREFKEAALAFLAGTMPE
jgi:pimeloyl-ACP methyl ester carboxylesterase